jgi:hypothetical protein
MTAINSLSANKSTRASASSKPAKPCGALTRSSRGQKKQNQPNLGVKNMTIETTQVTIPAYALCYAVYGEDDVMTDEEKASIDHYLTGLDIIGPCTAPDSPDGDSVEAYFTWNADLYGALCSGADVIECDAIVIKTDKKA